jgi:hypothetical protein
VNWFLIARRIIISYLQHDPLAIAGEVPVCSVCGEETETGGMWSGHQAIVVCSHACAKKVILLALDAISGADGPIPYAEWMKLADKSYDRWERYNVLQRESHRGFVDSLCPECQVKLNERRFSFADHFLGPPFPPRGRYQSCRGCNHFTKLDICYADR